MQQNKGTTEAFRDAGVYLVQLIGSALSGQKATEKPEKVAWEQVYQLAKQNSVEGLSYFGVVTLEEKPPKEMSRKWKSEVDKVLFRQLHFDEEREQILQEMRAKGLSYLPLKGIPVSGYYPEPGMRSMADNDILYGFVEECPEGGFCVRGGSEKEQEQTIREAQKQMVSIMKARGFKAEHLVGNHDCFLKEPFYNFEMHRQLVDEVTNYSAYYKNPWKRAVRDDADPYLYHFSDEDEYLFLVVHLHKHFSTTGCGIRNLADVYVFLNKKGNTMDWGYLRRELEKLGLKDFECSMRTLSQTAFDGGKELSKKEEEILYYLLGSGTYGSMTNNVEHRVEQIANQNGEDIGRAKRKYLLKRLFATEEECKSHYPFFYRHWYFRPVLPLYRVIRGLIVHPEKLWREWKILRKIN